MNNIKVLLLEDNENDMELIKAELLSSLEYKFEFNWVISKSDFTNAIKEFKPDIILSDYNLPQFNGLDAIKISQDIDPYIPIIIVTGTLVEEAAADCIKTGAWDYVVKERLTRLPIAFENSLKLKSERLKNRSANAEINLIKSKLDIQLKLLYDAIDIAPSSVVITDVNGDILYVNPEFEKVTGYKKDEVIGKNPRILQSGKHTKEFYENMWGRLTNHENWKGELLNKKKNGDLFWEKASIASITNEQGEISYYVSIKHDITELKDYEEKLKLSENWYRAIFGNTGTATCIINEDNTISLANKKFEELSGYSKEELEGNLKWTNFVSKEDLTKVFDGHENLTLSNTEDYTQYELSFTTKDGENKVILLTIMPI
jgi:PAS domain S-box-containing protein